MMIPCLKSEAIASETTPFNKLSRGDLQYTLIL